MPIALKLNNFFGENGNASFHFAGVSKSQDYVLLTSFASETREDGHL